MENVWILWLMEEKLDTSSEWIDLFCFVLFFYLWEDARIWDS